MIVKIMPAAGPGFPGVNYNDKKINSGKGELMKMKNFPSFINESSDKQKVRDYLRTVSNGNKKIIKPQFHAMISTKFQQHSKTELAKIAENFMNEMGYGKQPFTLVFHNDTDNNHIHIVSTRVDITTGKKIRDSFEKLRSQEALSMTLENIYGLKRHDEIKKLLNYTVSSVSQLETLLERNGYLLTKNKPDENVFDILKNGVKQRSIDINTINFEKSKNGSRKTQIKAILIKYKDLYSPKVFKVEDLRKQKSAVAILYKMSLNAHLKIKTEFESELQQKLRQLFGMDIVFHHKDNNPPFGYSLIDHKSSTVFKGSDILKMGELFEFTEDKIEKQLFERLKDYHIPSTGAKSVLLDYLRKNDLQAGLQDFMLFINTAKKDVQTYRAIQSEVRNYLRSSSDKKSGVGRVSIISGQGGEIYAVSPKHHFAGELQSLIGESEYQNTLQGERGNHRNAEQSLKNHGKDVLKAVDEMLFEMMKSTGNTKDPGENGLKKRRKKRKK